MCQGNCITAKANANADGSANENVRASPDTVVMPASSLDETSSIDIGTVTAPVPPPSLAPPRADQCKSTEATIPSVVWIDHILPFLDRPAWNSLVEASKEIYMLTFLSKLNADYENYKTARNDEAHTKTQPSATPVARARVQPPWPTHRPLQPKKSGGQGQAIESFCLSHDGEYLACASVIGSIELWSLRTGKLAWRNHAKGSEHTYGEHRYRTTRDDDSPALPMGSLLRFSPTGHVLACGFENKIVLWDTQAAIRHHRRRGKRCRPSLRSRTPSYAQPPQPQLAEYDQVYKHCSRPQGPEEDRQHQSFQTTLEIECRKGKIYEVTYLGFSAEARRLIARYGKTAYIWTRFPAAEADDRSGYCLTQKVSLLSSRSLMVFDPTLARLAMATNGGIGASSTTNSNPHGGRANNTRNDAASTADRSPGESSSSGGTRGCGKGIVNLWNLEEEPENECRRTVPTVRNSSNQILAYQNHVVRGLEFLRLGSDKQDVCLVSASLQGEVKFWKKQRQQLAYGCTAQDDYVCVCQFQSPGKIFSLASYSSIPQQGCFHGHGKIFLAAGEARGGVRVWKVSPAGSSAMQPFISSGALPANDENDADHYAYRLTECLATEVGDHVHYDNIKMLSFTPDGRSLVASRAYDAKIWFQTIWQ